MQCTHTFAPALFNSNVKGKPIDMCPKMQESKRFLAFTKQPCYC